MQEDEGKHAQEHVEQQSEVWNGQVCLVPCILEVEVDSVHLNYVQDFLSQLTCVYDIEISHLGKEVS